MFLLSLFFTAAYSQCPRPPSGCYVSHDVYQNIDCDGDGILDHVCTTTINDARWVALSTQGDCRSWVPDNGGVCTSATPADADPVCGSGLDSFFGGGSATWSHSQKGYRKRIPSTTTGGSTWTYESASDGCCAGHLGQSYRDWNMWCQSTGDPHILQFNHETNHAYINGDYLLYKNDRMTVAARHMNAGNVAGNVAFSISFDGVHLEYYNKHSAYGTQLARTEDLIKIGGSATDASGAKWTYASACAHLMDGHYACSCEWTDGDLYLQINDVTMFRAERIDIVGWDNVYGWNNLYLQVDPEDKKDTDTGMCTSEAMSDSQAGATHPTVDPYPDSRLDCTDDVFTELAGTDRTGSSKNPYWCLGATDMRRRSGYPTERRRFGQIIEDCKVNHADMLLKAYAICEPCMGLGYALEVCMMDACMMKDAVPSLSDDVAAGFSRGEAQGCTERKMAETAPPNRPNSCSPGTTWSPRYQSCLMEFEIKPAYTCAGPQLFAPMSGKYLSDCQELCARNAACDAFVHDETKNQCSLFTSCALVASTNKNTKTYMKVDRVAAVIAVGDTLDDDSSTEEDATPEGPHASYGTPGFEDVQDTVNDVHNDVEDLGDSLKDLHDSLEDNVTDLQDEVKDLTDDIEESLTDLHDEMEESLTDLHDELEDSIKDLHTDLEDEVDSLNEDLTDGLDEAQKAVQEIRAALADLHAATTYSAGQSPPPTYTGSQPAPVQATPYGQTGMGTPTIYGNPATQNSNDDDETAWKTIAIVSMVLTILLICGALICVVGYIGCMLKK